MYLSISSGECYQESEGIEEHLELWRKGHPCYKVAKNLADLCVAFCRQDTSATLYIYLRFPSKVLKAMPSFPLPDIVKCERKETN